MGIILCVTGAFIAFGLTWHMWWLVVVGGIAAFSAVVGRGFVRDATRIIPASEVEQDYLHWLREVAAAQPVSRAEETEPVNRGLAARPLAGAAE
jgi:cytochrome o ubiquinol oxidase subunit 1